MNDWAYLTILVSVVTTIFWMVVGWRAMRAHERIAEEVLLAALEALKREHELGDFQPGELDHLLAEGENSGEPIEWEEVVGELRELGRKASKRGAAS